MKINIRLILDPKRTFVKAAVIATSLKKSSQWDELALRAMTCSCARTQEKTMGQIYQVRLLALLQQY